MERVSGLPPRMWGTSIVGFGSYHYKYASGHEGDSCLVGFSSRKGDISVYLMPGYDSAEARALLAQLGRHKIGKACLYVRRLSDIQLPVLEQLVARSVSEIQRRYPQVKQVTAARPLARGDRQPLRNRSQEAGLMTRGFVGARQPLWPLSAWRSRTSRRRSSSTRSWVSRLSPAIRRRTG